MPVDRFPVGRCSEGRSPDRGAAFLVFVLLCCHPFRNVLLKMGLVVVRSWWLCGANRLHTAFHVPERVSDGVHPSRHAVFWCFVSGSGGVGSSFAPVSPCSGGVFDTPVDPGVCNGFRGVRGVRVCVGSGFGVGFSLAARRGTVPPAWGFGSGSVRWWFENSRACFVLLLYSQMIASPSTARAFACGCREAG